MSDLHLEQDDTTVVTINDIINDTDVSDIILILAGDIGQPWLDSYWLFLFSCADRYKHVLFITGNHEYYNRTKSMNEINKMIEIKQKPQNLHFLNNTKFVIDGVTFLGSTLWTNINIGYTYEIYKKINDFRNIMIENDTNNKKLKHIMIQDIIDLHNFQLNWIKNNIKTVENIEEKIILITHHLPTPQLSHSKYDCYNDINSSFFTDLSKCDVFDNKIKFWFCGHTHIPMEYMDINTNTKFVTNPMGYTSENSNFSIKEFTL